jgi:hypothetical protein
MVLDMATTDTVHAISSRHFADADEGGRTCNACGRPWPCDVRRLVGIVEVGLDPASQPIIHAVAARRTSVGAIRRRSERPLPVHS